jgi:inner membrane protein
MSSSPDDLRVLYRTPTTIGYRLGVAYGSLLGHRGLTHSLPFAPSSRLRRPSGVSGVRALGRAGGAHGRNLFVATASHGILDAMTTGGLGVAFFSPFSNARYVFPWTPILISPLGIRPFVSERGLRVLHPS